MKVQLRSATVTDVALLADMNERLIEDEGSRNQMDVTQLHERMSNWLKTGWQADLIVVEDSVVGYALYQRRQDEYFPDNPLVYLRQFFIERAHRRKGLGREALRLLQHSRFPTDGYVVIDVLASNSAARGFWKASGFGEYSTTMHCGACPGTPERQNPGAQPQP